MGERLTEALQLVAPGTAVREAIDNIVRARNGALLVFADEDEIHPLISGGIPIHIELPPMILYELAKMDGAILLDRRGQRIMYANVQLMPDATISSSETGTRHRTAERVAKQIDALAISISAAPGRRLALHRRHPLRARGDPRDRVQGQPGVADPGEVQVAPEPGATSLTALEFEDAVTLYDVLSVLQRSEMVLRISGEIERYIIELGSRRPADPGATRGVDGRRARRPPGRPWRLPARLPDLTVEEVAAVSTRCTPRTCCRSPGSPRSSGTARTSTPRAARVASGLPHAAQDPASASGDVIDNVVVLRPPRRDHERIERRAGRHRGRRSRPGPRHQGGVPPPPGTEPPRAIRIAGEEERCSKKMTCSR